MEVQFRFRSRFDPELLQHPGQGNLHLVDREPLADALAVAATERPKREGNDLGRVLLQKPLRLECVRIRKELCVVMRGPRGKPDPDSFLELDAIDFDVFRAEPEVVVGGPVQSEVLVKRGLQVVQLRDCLAVDFAVA